MQEARIYFCYGKSHITEPKELRLVGTVRHYEGGRQLNLYQCPTCKLVQLIEEVVNAQAK